ncbi:hypothetical protein [Desulfurobacterium sp.]
MRKLENLLFFYELYLEGLDERNLLQWSMVLDVRSEIEKQLRRTKRVPFHLRKSLKQLDKILKGKLVKASSDVNFGRLREIQFPKPSRRYWWYYPEVFSCSHLQLQSA